MRWIGHVQRRYSEYFGRRMLKMELPIRSQRGRSKTRFMDMMREHTQIVGEREEDAEDRERWRRMICYILPLLQ